MSVRLFFCLVFITKIIASHYQSTPQYESTSKYIIHNQRNLRKLVTESLNDSPVEVQSTKITENKTNGTGNVPPIKRQEKNETVVNKLGANKEGINTQSMKINGTVIGVTKIPPIVKPEKNETVISKPNANTEGMNAESSQVINSYPPYSTYEVTENVIDIPDDRTPAGPIDINYTFKPNLNLAKPTNKTNTDKTTEANIKSKKNCLSILHISAEFDDKVHEKHDNKVIGFLKGVKEHVKSFRRGIVNTFHGFFHKHHDFHEHGDRFERSVGKEGN